MKNTVSLFIMQVVLAAGAFVIMTVIHINLIAAQTHPLKSSIYKKLTSFSSSLKPKVVFADNGVSFYSDDEAEWILSQVTSSEVIGTVTQTSQAYKNPTASSAKTNKFSTGDKVEIIQDRTLKWYKVKSLSNSHEGWIKAENLSIPSDPATNTSKMSSKDTEAFVNILDFPSNTNYLVWTDIDRQLTNIFTGKRGNWHLAKTIVCATGKNVSPTKRGLYRLSSDRGDFFYSERLKSGAKYWVRYSDTFLYHSVAMNKQQQVVDSGLGMRRSSGCVRMSVEDAKWFYETIPGGTTVFIH